MKTRYSISRMSEEDICKTLGILSLRSLTEDHKDFPKPFHDEKKLFFDKEEVMKYFNVDNLDEPFIRLAEASEYLGISESKLAYLSLHGKLPNYRVKNVKGSGYLYRKSELTKFKEVTIEGDTRFINYFIGNEMIKEWFLYFLSNESDSRDKDIVLRHFLKGMSFEDISQEFGMSRERIRQIVNRLVRRVCEWNHFSPIEFVNLERKMIRLETELKILRATIPEEEPVKIEFSTTTSEYLKDFLTKKVRNLDLSVRAINTMVTADIFSVYDMFEFCYENDFKELSKLRNLGVKTRDEIRDFVESKVVIVKKDTGIALDELFKKKQAEQIYK